MRLVPRVKEERKVRRSSRWQAGLRDRTLQTSFFLGLATLVGLDPDAEGDRGRPRETEGDVWRRREVSDFGYEVRGVRHSPSPSDSGLAGKGSCRCRLILGVVRATARSPKARTPFRPARSGPPPARPARWLN